MLVDSFAQNRMRLSIAGGGWDIDWKLSLETERDLHLV